jgi:Mn-dependent DtxR family transcriptional regulator
MKKTTAAPRSEALARRLVVELFAMAGSEVQWKMLSTVAQRLKVDWHDADAAALIAHQEGWIKYQMHSVALEEAGRVLAKKVKP